MYEEYSFKKKMALKKIYEKCGPHFDENDTYQIGLLDHLFTEYGIIDYLKKFLDEFIGILYNSYYDDKPALLKQELYKSDLVKVYSEEDPRLIAYLEYFIPYDNLYIKFLYFICSIISKDAYENEKYAFSKFNLQGDFEKIIFEKMDINENLDSAEKIRKNVNKEKYDAVEKRYKEHNFDIPYEFEIRVAYFEYEFYDKLRFTRKNSVIIFTAKDVGDGCGFDEYEYDKESKIEKLYEVKSSKNNYFIMTANEIRVMKNTLNQPNTEYYVKGYFYDDAEDGRNYIIKREVLLKYMKEHQMLVDQETGEVYYTYKDEENTYQLRKNQNLKIKLKKEF